MTKSMGLGVIGAGAIAGFHFEAFKQSAARVAMIADISRERAQPYLNTFGAKYADHFQEVLRSPEVNVVVCLVPSKFHHEIVKSALEAGKHVICEKTLTLCARDSLELARLAQQKNLLLFTSYMKRFFPAVKKAAELIPRLGHITSVYCRTYQGVGADLHTGKVPEFFTPVGGRESAMKQIAGGGILVAGGSHIYDLLIHLLGKPKRVFARLHRRPGFDIDFLAHALLELELGGDAHFEGNWHPYTKIGYEQRAWDEGFEISGVNGRLIVHTPVWNQPQHNAAQLRYYDNGAETWTDFLFDIVNPFIEAEKYFLSRIVAGTQEPVYDRYVGYRVDHLLEQTQRSADMRQPVDLTWDA